MDLGVIMNRLADMIDEESVKGPDDAMYQYGFSSAIVRVQSMLDKETATINLRDQVRRYAFNNPDVDLDKATFKILTQTITEAVSRHSYEGLYDLCFKETR